MRGMLSFQFVAAKPSSESATFLSCSSFSSGCLMHHKCNHGAYIKKFTLRGDLEPLSRPWAFGFDRLINGGMKASSEMGQNRCA